MGKWSLVWLVALVACGGSSNKKKGDGGITDTPGSGVADAGVDAYACVAPMAPPSCNPTTPPTAPATNGSATCNVLAQTGCGSAEKCTWLEDSSSVGHIGCAPTGTVQNECACHYGSAGSAGYDDCVRGNVCNGGLCKTICDTAGGTPMCGSALACTTYASLFGDPAVAGVCEYRCDPLADNDFLATGSKPGCICGSAKGCYGSPSTTTPTQWTCTPETNTTLVHRSACTTGDGCAPSTGFVYVNGCAQGYEPLLFDAEGSSQIDCIALCHPGNTYLGNPGAQHPIGLHPHACGSADARGTFDTASNGDQCAYMWIFEVDGSTGNLVRSPTSDTVGFCVDHTKYTYDNGAGSAVWPACTTLPLTGSGSADPTAGQFGCVDSHTAGQPFNGKRRIDVRRPYHLEAR